MAPRRRPRGARISDSELSQAGAGQARARRPASRGMMGQVKSVAGGRLGTGRGGGLRVAARRRDPSRGPLRSCCRRTRRRRRLPVHFRTAQPSGPGPGRGRPGVSETGGPRGRQSLNRINAQDATL